MIELEVTRAAVLYVGVFLAMMFGIWLYTEMTVWRGQRFLEKQYHWRCIFCGFSYLDESGDPVSQCPRCQSYNSTEDRLAREVPTAVEWESAPHAAENDARRNPSHRKRPHARRRGPRHR